jgi:hypothetical protein
LASRTILALGKPGRYFGDRSFAAGHCTNVGYIFSADSRCRWNEPWHCFRAEIKVDIPGITYRKIAGALQSAQIAIAY